jgi:biotin operon repressor
VTFAHEKIVDGIDFLSCPRKATLRAYAQHADASGRSFPSQSTVAKMAGCSRKTVNEATSYLRLIGLLDVEWRERPEGRGDTSNNVYVKLSPADIQRASQCAMALKATPGQDWKAAARRPPRHPTRAGEVERQVTGGCNAALHGGVTKEPTRTYQYEPTRKNHPIDPTGLTHKRPQEGPPMGHEEVYSGIEPEASVIAEDAAAGPQARDTFSRLRETANAIWSRQPLVRGKRLSSRWQIEQEVSPILSLGVSGDTLIQAVDAYYRREGSTDGAHDPLAVAQVLKYGFWRKGELVTSAASKYSRRRVEPGREEGLAWFHAAATSGVERAPRLS